MDISDPAAVRHWSQPLVLHRGVQVGLWVLLAWLFAFVIAAAVSRNLMFDGAMNLEIARSLVEGHGPRRLYDTADLFPPGVQSKEPYVLLGAAIFRLYGITPLTAQLPNLIYLSLLCVVMLIAIRRFIGMSAALTAAIFVLAIPAITQYALNGYGEIPTLFFGLSALAVVAWPGSLVPHWRKRCLLAGVLAGLALATKVVGVAQVASIGLVLLCRLFVEARRTPRVMLGAIITFAAGLAAPLLLVEFWRWGWLGTHDFIGWWRFQLGSILSQAGATPRGAQAALPVKAAQHFQILSSELGIGRNTVAAMILVPLVALGFAFACWLRKDARAEARWWLLGLSLIVLFYFPWWLALVPTEKAWLRYIYIGLVCLAMLAAIALASNIDGAIRNRGTAVRTTHAVFAVCLLAIYGPLVARAARQQMSFTPSEDVVRTLEAARLVSALPPDRIALGFGWYAAPTVQLYSDRALMDWTDWPVGSLVGKPAYLVADRATLATDMLGRVLARYPHRALMQTNPFAQVYVVDFSNPVNFSTIADESKTLPKVEFAKVDYSPTTGMEPFDPMGGRFVESDSEILLRYEGQPEFELAAYMALPGYYREPTPLAGRILIGRCPPIPFAFQNSGWRQFRFPLACRPAAGSNVRVRIVLDNVFDLPLLYDRQRAMLLGSIGFTGEPSSSPRPAQ